MNYPTIWPQFLTFTIYNWNHLLKENGNKDIIIETGGISGYSIRLSYRPSVVRLMLKCVNNKFSG